MINVSNAFREQLNNDNRNYLCYVKITLHDETVLNVENDKLWSGGVEIERAVSSDNTFDIGSVIINKATIVLNNIYDDFTEYDFSDATVYIEIGLKLENETIERVKLGTFYVDEPKYNGSLISLECLDSMSRFDVDYSESNLTYPATLLEIVRDACSACGVTNGIATLPNGDYTVSEKPDVESLTFRQVLQWAAQICCQWFTIDENDRLVSGWYVVPDEDSEYHTISGVNSITVDTDDVVITGIKVTEFVEDTDEDPAVFQSGNDGYVLGISENKLIPTGKGSAVAVYLGKQLIGMRFRPFSATCQNDPTIEAGDPVSISDYKGNVFHSFVTNFKFTTGNSENFSCGAESAKRKSASRYSQLTQAYVQNRKNIRKQKTEFEKQMEELANRINTSSGLYMTEEVQSDGSTIYYLHNKPTLEESMIIWKMTAEAFAVSNDGGKSWTAGLTVDGELIARIMNTIGINFDWGVGGSLVIQDEDGNETFYANAETGEIRIVASSLSISGKTVQQITQEIAGEVAQEAAQEEANKTITEFVQGDYADTIQDIYNSLDQKSETWYQATDPALEWTQIESIGLKDTTGNNILDTTSSEIETIWEKEKNLHDGDLWKNSTTNVEYIYQNGEWVEMPIPDEVFDMIDGKAQIFVAQPTPPYATGDVWFTGTTILVCNRDRENGSFSESDWGKKDNYTDDSALYSFIEGDYSNTVEELKTQADKKAETWYQSTDPSTGWSETEKLNHKGDLWYNTSDEKTYIYNGSAWEITKTTPPDEVFDQIDGKAQIFIAQPTPPYQKGDLWFNSATSDIMTCINSRSSGNYTASDWQKRNKYTDDSYAQEVNKELNQFISGYQDEIKEIQNQVDQKAETWYQTSDPALQWTGKENIPLADTTGASILDTTGSTITTIWESEKMVHDGDLWHNPSNNKEYIYQDGEWNETSIPDDVFDIIDGKAQIFVSQPKPPYSVGDLWFNSATSDIMTCVQSRSSGSYTAGDWQKRNKYTDDTYAQDVAKELLDFSDAVTGDISSLQSQLDGKIETFYYNYKPTLSNLPASGWKTDAERARHVGDLFYWQSQGYTYRFQTSGSTYVWQQIQDSQITEAMEEASKAQDTADSKRRVFVTTPVPPYDVGDLWVGNSSSDLMRCQTARGSGSFSSSDWIKAVKYTDDSAVDSLDQSLNQQDIFNRLTNNGQTQGIYLNNGKLYINATYIHGGQLSLGGTNNTNGSILILDASGNQIGTIDRNGINAQGDFEIKKAVSPWNFDAAFKNVTVFHYGRSIQRGGLRVTAQTSDGAGYEGDIIISPAPYTNTNSYTDRAYAIIQSNRALAIQSKIEDDEQWGRIDMDGPEFTISTGKGNMSAPAFSTSAADGGSSPTSTIMRSKNASIKCATNIALTGNTEITGSLSATGSKNRIVKTPNYGDRLQYCYEMTNPMFGDIGEAKTDENGECYLYIDDIFKETVSTNIEYQVFLQKEGQGDVWIEEKNEEYFAVKGTPNLKFAWEIKAKQKEYEYERLKMHEEESDVYEEDYAKTAQKEIENSINDYEEQAIKMMEEYYSMMEGAFI